MSAKVAFTLELSLLLQVGVQDTEDRGEPFTTLHLLRFVLTSNRARAAVTATGASADVVMAAVNRALDAGVADASADADAVQTIANRAAAHVAGSGRARIETTDVLIMLAEASDRAAGAVLAAHGVTSLALKLHVSRPARRAGLARGLIDRVWPRRRAPPALGPDDPVQIVMHNDDFTKKEFVVYILERHFGVAHDQAIALMERVHHVGLARLDPLPHAEAVRRIDEVTQVARAEGFPLRLSLDGEPVALPRAQVRRR